MDPSICTATSRWGGEWKGGSDGGFEGVAWTLFARSSTDPISIQIIGDPVRGPAGPYAMVLRYGDRRADVENRETENIGDFAVAVDMVPNGNAHARWNLDGGGEGYLRSRGLDRNTVVGILEGLTVRDESDDRKGFNLAPSVETSNVVELLHEGLWGTYSGSYAAIECGSPDGEAVYRISAINDVVDPIVEYAFVSDRPPPLEVGYREGSLIVIDGFGDRPDAPTVDDVHNADETTWAAIPISG